MKLQTCYAFQSEMLFRALESLFGQQCVFDLTLLILLKTTSKWWSWPYSPMVSLVTRLHWNWQRYQHFLFMCAKCFSERERERDRHRERERERDTDTEVTEVLTALEDNLKTRPLTPCHSPYSPSCLQLNYWHNKRVLAISKCLK